MQKGKNPYELLTSEEIMEEFKQAARQWHWNTHTLNVMLRCETLTGMWDNTLKCHLFTRKSVLKLIEHNNGLLEDRIIDLKQWKG